MRGVLGLGRRGWVSAGRADAVVVVVVVVAVVAVVVGVGHRGCFGRRICAGRRVVFRLDLERCTLGFWVVCLDVEVTSSTISPTTLLMAVQKYP